MSDCMNNEQIERYAAGKGTADELAAIERHLATCEACRRKVEAARTATADAGNSDSHDSRPVDAAAAAKTESMPKVSVFQQRGDEIAVALDTMTDGYTVLGILPRGGQAIVYKAVQKATNRTVAVKVLLQGAHAPRQAQFRFKQEIELAASLRHPNIVTIFDSGIARGQYYYAMEYIQGKPLDEYIEEHKLSLSEIMTLFGKVASAVAYAHRRGVIHRDLKPANILVDDGGEPHVLDFGLAKVADGFEQSYERTVMASIAGQVMGTLAYMSPEQATADPEAIDVRTDVYSLGIILYLVLTERFPYPVGGPMFEVLSNIKSMEAVRPGRLVRGLSSEIEAIVMKAMAKEPQRRYQSGSELLSRRCFLQRSMAGAATVGVWRGLPVLAAFEPKPWEFKPDENLIGAPADPADWPAFREQLQAWREQTKRRLNYSDALYRKPEFAWAASSFACCFLMMCDETFYDRRSGACTVEAFLDHGQREFGGYDSLVLWHAYPRIGVDDRNQFDFYRDMPGGLNGLRDLSRRCRRRGARVFIDYNPWDTGTRREDKSDLDALAELAAAIEADGIFLDTMGKGAAEFRAALDAARPGVILEGEGALPVENIHDHHASWAQWFNDGDAPGVLRNKWFERRHIQHQIKRWEYDHTGELHAAWMNGSGMMVWENVFGSWVPWSPRDRSILRAMLPIQRRYGGLFMGENWTPLAPTGQTGLFAGLWEGPGPRLWTLVNRRNEPVSGVLFEIGTQAGERVYDLIKGEELRTEAGESRLRIDGVIPARGIGCILAAKPDQLGHDFGGFVKRQRETSAIADFDAATPVRETRLVDAAPTDRATQVPEGMVEIPPATLELVIEMRQRECGCYESAPPGGHRPADSYRFNTVTFRRRVEFKRFAIDETPVTNAEFAEFLKAAKWKPKRSENFLKHWAAGKPPAGREDHPVVYVDLDDARACAGWKGKRLPTEEEWQYAAQGADGRVYPWGNEMQPGRCNDGTSGGTMPVKAFPLGRSPFGCYDLCGNVWHWTESERTDGRTRFCIVRGGAFFSARGSNWYVDGGPRPANFATKFLLMWPGLDRCGTIGFRCVKDLD